MKELSEMTEAELLELDGAEIEARKRLLLAENGTQIRLKPLEPTYIEVLGPTHEVYRHPWMESNYAHPDREVIQSVVDSIREGLVYTDYDYKLGDQYRHRSTESLRVPQENEHPVEKMFIYSSEEYFEVKAALVENADLKRTYEAELKLYRAYLRSLQDVSDEILDPIREARRNKDKREWIKRLLGEYLGIAEGDGLVALRFFAKAYSDSPPVLVRQALTEVEGFASSDQKDLQGVCDAQFPLPEIEEEKDV